LPATLTAKGFEQFALMKKMTICSCLLTLSFIWIASCKHDVDLPAASADSTGTGNGGGTGGGGTGGTGGTVTCNPDTAYFQQMVLPIFVSNCSLSGCHDVASHQDGIVLTNYAGVRAEVKPGDLNDSEIWEKINETNPSDRMPPPPRNPLPQAQKDIIKKWILQGARNNSCEASACDSANVTYSGTIKSIIAAKCQGCHSGSAPANGYDFTQYSVLKARVTEGKLWGAINHLPGYSPMPKNGNKLSSCELTQFRKWIDAGAPNN
jgi:hypothetical protein